MSTELGRVESDSDVVFGVNVADTSETLADSVLKLTGVDLKKKTKSVDVETNGGKIKNDSAELRRYVLVYKEVDGDNFESEDVGENRKQEQKVENLDNVVVLAGSASVNENLKLSESDLVWAKVNSYPWWPGQVFDASVASKKAKRYFKRGKLLVAFSGDCSFAWSDVSRIKPFHQHFSQMVNQSNSAEFRDAIDCSLEEVSRRVEFGLSCACISEEAYNKLKTQNIINAGIREESCLRYGGDKLSNAMFFEPAKLVDYMKRLACFPSYDAAEELQFVSNRAQLLAFQQWRGYSHFTEYETFIKSVESAVPGVSVLEPNTDEKMSSKRRKTDHKDNDEHKDRADEETKEKPLSDGIAKKRFGSKSIEKLDGKLHSEKKRKVDSSESGKYSASQNSDKENNLSAGDANKLQKVSVPESIGIDPSSYEDFEKFVEEISCSDLIDDSKETITEASEPNDVKDTSEKQILPADKDITEPGSKLQTGLKDCSADSSAPSDVKSTSEQQIFLPANKDITDSGSKEQIGLKDCSADSSAPNALFLNFAESDSVPSKEKLIKIFNRFGPLRESETKAMKNGKRAKVVFKRSEDAETAFSSAGKYSIFGPSLLSYKLKYVCPKAKQSNNMTN